MRTFSVSWHFVTSYFFIFYMEYKKTPIFDVQFRKKLFFDVFGQILDYADPAVIKKCTRWGLEQYAQLEKHKKLIATGNTSDYGHFIYGIAFAVIVGEFAKRAFNDYFWDECEIDLNALGLNFRDIEGYMEEDMSTERRDELRKGNYVCLQDIWSAIQEWKRHMYKELTEIYKAENKEETDPTLPGYAIYETLLKIFERVDEDGISFISISTSGEMAAYSYVNEGFQC